ncbi:uncharacterized protein FOMMEDRAFT_159447 [Fomitiporia mediterranea MF3/22]|uniref:uncharacterized protein n=1 Tax=Fomitiporia mediterranea (strain MF3/22) TaxID=694068 RepID=UPI00044090D7|nr:uncharacterized protein FOMMEDRAFT_159447 [Fomitiporia mediterranea MF3/22]EJD00681.1 hypothetical protein FOMMEDRAFT_159447 [Fomitiporia mediterranea MF3/22]
MKFFTAPIVALTLAACALAQIRVSLNPFTETDRMCTGINHYERRQTSLYSCVPIHVHVVGSGRATGDSPTVTVAPGMGFPKIHVIEFASNVATLLQARFELHRLIADLGEVVELHQATLQLLPNNHSITPRPSTATSWFTSFNRSLSLNSLANALQTRFEQHWQAADIDEAIEHNRAALLLCQDSHPKHSNVARTAIPTYHTAEHTHDSAHDEAWQPRRCDLTGACKHDRPDVEIR